MALLGFVLFVIVIVVIALCIKDTNRAAKEAKQEKQREEAILVSVNAVNENVQRLMTFIRQYFLVQPCTNCHEFTMRLLDISPNYRSIHYQCVHCGKKMRAPAGTPEVNQLAGLTDVLREYKTLYNPSKYQLMPLEFKTVPAPMPYEQTTRTPIPEAVRTEVWRRDQGRCVNCGSKENLHFDHIIPVSRGGGTSAKNLQLLCQSCNLTKGTEI
jgi:hypothetical protein